MGWMGRWGRVMRTVAMAGLVLAVGCDWFKPDEPPRVDPGNGVGEPCDMMEELCREGLICDPMTALCTADGTVAEGGECELSAQCTDGFYCGPERLCTTAGEGAEGADCLTTADCQSGLICAAGAFWTECTPGGTGDIGAACGTDLDCVAGLTCFAEVGGVAMCTDALPAAPGTVTPPVLPAWPGETCATDTTTPTAYFELPQGDGMDGDFYRLPFPNDARMTAGGLDLSGFPTPETAVTEDVIGRHVAAVESDLDGFSTNPVVFFRFSEPYDWGSLDGAIQLVNVDPESPAFGQQLGLAWLTTGGQISRHICANFLGVRTGHGSPLEPGTTYAVILSNTITNEGGSSFERSPDLSAMLAGSAPTDPGMADAWNAYQPLRDWAADADTTDPATILNAAVFTTQSEARYDLLRDAVHAADLPTASDLVECTAGAASSCDDGTIARNCEGADGTVVTEIHGRIALPIFQEGTAPYETPEQGGRLDLSAPTVTRTENVCFALTLPAGMTMPAEGWPVLIAAHGTGGSFRTARGSGLAESAASVGAATLAIDLPSHGDRRGDSEQTPDRLFFNFVNPQAARGNVAQGTADLFSLIRFAVEGTIPAGDSPTGAEIVFDPGAIVLFAHSQGATHADQVLPWESDLSAAVLSGNGGDLTLSLLNKTSPVNIEAVLPYALLDIDGGGNLPGGAFHPALALFQTWYDGVDPVNFGRRLHVNRPTDGAGAATLPSHVMMTFGPDDTFTPEPVQQAYAVAARLPTVAPQQVTLPLTSVDAPLSDNVDIEGNLVTMGVRTLLPTDDVDGHFVARRTDAGQRVTDAFLQAALQKMSPAITAP